MNKKIKNANPKQFNNIQFKSTLEVSVYKTLLQEGFNPEYEKTTFTIWKGSSEYVKFYTKNVYKRKNKHINVCSETLIEDNRPLNDITYTPDFIFNYENKTIIVEVKGFQNDVYPYKMKMFRDYLSQNTYPNSHIIWEIFNLKQLKECINLLKTSQMT